MSDSNDWGLKPKHAEFVRIYLTNGRNATDAYKKVYPKNKTPEVNASKLLRNDKVFAAIRQADAKIQEKFELTHERIVEELAEMAFSRPTDYLSWDEDRVNITPSEDLTPRQMAGIASVEQVISETGERYIRIKHIDRRKTLQDLHKLAGFKHGQGAGASPDRMDRETRFKRLSEFLRKRKNRTGEG